MQKETIEKHEVLREIESLREVLYTVKEKILQLNKEYIICLEQKINFLESNNKKD